MSANPFTFGNPSNTFPCNRIIYTTNPVFWYSIVGKLKVPGNFLNFSPAQKQVALGQDFCGKTRQDQESGVILRHQGRSGKGIPGL